MEPLPFITPWPSSLVAVYTSLDLHRAAVSRVLTGPRNTMVFCSGHSPVRTFPAHPLGISGSFPAFPEAFATFPDQDCMADAAVFGAVVLLARTCYKLGLVATMEKD
nr:hypothetical protein CFP56_32227 [Quercus suber]